jgi:hypothetical protein
VTLDPVHVNGIAELAGAIARSVDDGDHTALAETVFEEWLDPLCRDGRVVLEPLSSPRRRAVAIDDVALVEDPFGTAHGLDSGTINPTTFTNGLVLDVAQAAMAAVPTDLDLHRSRSLVATVHANDATATFETDWTLWDGGYSRRRVMHAPRVSRYAEGVVHALSLYLAESEHALAHANVVDDLLVLDGPIYPTELLAWRDRDAELRDLAEDAQPRQVLENYVRLVEQFDDQDVPLVGFVKNPASNLVTRAVRERGGEAPWVDDAALFRRLLERREDGERSTDEVTFTSWFRSRGGTDRTMAADGDALGVDRALEPEAYEVTFFVLFDPREAVVFRVEAPYAVTRDEETRERLTRYVLREVAAERGPPRPVAKADSLARIGAAEKVALREKFEDRFDAESLRTYDDVRWGGEGVD